MADFMRAMIELCKADPELAARTEEHLRKLRARQREERRRRGKRPATSTRELSVA
ncbi:hypothetical protein [Streptomyces sp. NBC_01304]|uniref:hypothetical protein n=1 Tax=Streptomyces sp. NBC_01304 TaxID=2903818 RepID=UPI002E130FF7|nr:hypothetical protein OG430_48860 [Streptomyces sp. NBC_01304]